MILDNLTEKLGEKLGKFGKMLIMSFKDTKSAESGEKAPDKNTLRAFINPESYKLNYRVNAACKTKAIGSTGEQSKFHNIENTELSFEFLFDDTGIIDGDFRDILTLPNKGVFEDVKKFRELLMQYDGDAHQTPIVKLVWGTLLFVGRATDLSIHYKLFDSGGMPIRAVVNVKFHGTVNEDKQVALNNNQSPDLTHIIRVKAGDTLPLLCKKVYGNSKYYFQVAAANDLGNFRRLEPGMEILFPPIDKTKN